MKAEEIAKVCAGVLNGNKDAEISGVCTDTRKNFKDSIYVALIGEKFDGHDYIEKAIEGGSSAILWSEKEKAEEVLKIKEKHKEICFIQTENTLKALGKVSGMVLDEYKKSKKSENFTMPVAAITGSVGKTTTKEMTALALSAKYDVCKTAGNFNNEIGVPLTIMSLKDQNALVVEFGMRGMGQIEYLTDIVKPSLGIITNIGTAHLELLGSRSRIFMAKMEIVSGIEENGYLVVNGDNDFLENKALLEAYIMKVFNKKINVVLAGEGENCDFRAENVIEDKDCIRFDLNDKIHGKKYPVVLKTEGRHHVIDASLAFAAGILLGTDGEKTAEKLSGYGKDSIRQKIIERNGIKIIDDTYNANPESMKAALSVLKKSEGRRVAVLGSMLELGEKTNEFHEKTGEYAAECADILVAAGTEAKYMGKGFLKIKPDGVVIFTENSTEAGNAANRIIKKGDTVLVKGSRGLLMEKAAAVIGIQI